MGVLFVIGLTARLLVYYTIRREEWFCREFEKRIHNFLVDEDNLKISGLSFFKTTKKYLEKTYYELFEIRSIMKRRKSDYVTSLSDRLFLIQTGAAHLVKDTLNKIKFLKYNQTQPKFMEISKSVYQHNAAFKRVLGVIPANLVNDMVNILPGLFIVGGIFGTFLGIMKALPALSAMDVGNVEGTKMIMDTFLLKISFSMSTSIVGIVFSVGMTILNSLFNPEKVFVKTVDQYELCLENLWQRCENNEFDMEDTFDEHRDPLEALAELSVQKELDKSKLEKGNVKPPRKSDRRHPLAKDSHEEALLAQIAQSRNQNESESELDNVETLNKKILMEKMVKEAEALEKNRSGDPGKTGTDDV